MLKNQMNAATASAIAASVAISLLRMPDTDEDCSGAADNDDAGTTDFTTWYVDFDGDDAPDYAFADKDFNVRSLIGNAVLCMIEWQVH